jgi:hypothetical protein
LVALSYAELIINLQCAMSARLISSQKLPILENGDRVTREEFERRYHRMPNVKKAELIEGVVYVPSPLRYRQHGLPHSQIMTWLSLPSQWRAGIFSLVGQRSRISLVCVAGRKL